MEKEQEIIEGNHLIAEFMGYAVAVNVKHESGNPTYVRREKDSSTSFQTLEWMPYHTSWDWLMPVIIKLNDKTDNDAPELAFLYKPLWTIQHIAAIWEDVVKGIQYYNSQN
jgi:hypothetical protein